MLEVWKLLTVSSGSPGGSVVKNSSAKAGDVGLIPEPGKSLEKEMATHSSVLAWEIPWMEEPGRLYSLWGHKRVRYDLATNQQQQEDFRAFRTVSEA